MRLILIRHAAAIGQDAASNLSLEGFEQAKALAEHLISQPVDALFSSPYERALQTIQPFALKTRQKIKVLDDLKERVLSGKPQADWLEHVEHSFHDRDYQLPGGESLNTTTKRALSAIDVILKANTTRPLAISHGNLIAGLLNHIDPSFGFEDWQAMTNPDGFEITFNQGDPRNFRQLNLT